MSNRKRSEDWVWMIFVIIATGGVALLLNGVYKLARRFFDQTPLGKSVSRVVVFLIFTFTIGFLPIVGILSLVDSLYYLKYPGAPAQIVPNDNGVRMIIFLTIIVSLVISGGVTCVLYRLMAKRPEKDMEAQDD